MKNRIKVFIALIAGFVISFNAQAQQLISYFGSPPVLSEQQENYLNTIRNQETTLNYEVVKVEADIFDQNSLALKLYNLNYQVVKESMIVRSTSNYTWFGKVLSDPYSSIMIVVNGDMVTAAFTIEYNRFMIYPLSEGLHVLQQLNTGAFPPDESAEEYREMLSPKPEVQQLQDRDIVRDAGGGSRVNDCTIRYLVAYTDDVDAAYADPHSLVQGSVDDHNLVNSNSNVTHTVELARSVMVTYGETGNFTTDRDRFQNSSDGFMDNIHTLRDLYDADVCQLLLNSGSGCGLAYAIEAVNASDAFAVTKASCAIGNHTFAHETGHLYGCRHDPYVDSNTSPYAYGHGFVYLPSRWRTTMAYNDQCEDTSPFTNCTRLGYWSDNVNTYGGVTMGTSATHDNARVTSIEDDDLAAHQSQVDNKSVWQNETVPDEEQGHFRGNLTCTNGSYTLTYNSGSIGSMIAANEITLTEGFWARYNSEFEAKRLSCTALRPMPDDDDITETVDETSKENSFTGSFDVYPNPTNDLTNINIILSEEANVRLVLYNMQGQIVETIVEQSLMSAGQHFFEFDAGEIEPGVYFIYLFNDDNKELKRLVVQK